MMPVIRPAVADDFLAFVETLPPYRVRAWAAEIDGRVIGVGGIGFPPGQPPLAFVDIEDEARRYPVALHRTGKSFMASVKAWGIPRIVAMSDADNETARKWLARLGFTEIGEIVDGKRLHAWSAS